MTACPLCGYKENKKYIYFQDFLYERCNKCSLVFLDKDSVREDKELYTDEYLKKWGYADLNSYITQARRITANHYISLLEKYTTKGNLLDVGCSTGAALKVARDRGWNIYGIDINERAVTIAQDFLKTDNIKAGYLADDVFPDDFFSAILMFDVIEHLREPRKFMKILKKKVKREGVILIITPDADSLSAKILKRKWPHLELEHTCLYSKRSINLLLEMSQFKILKTGWAVKFISIDILRRYVNYHPEIFPFKTLAAPLKFTHLLDSIIFPFDVGEMYVLAQRLDV